ncbi:CU044_5270 family protein [Micromonospora sp. NBC_01813]|uniref:CU044_5270 family protein n=1 Tax=Micromonospora sp. NBC_01813 TaxID=2975988 RepID=UPI002DD8C1F7|nr:CU044_5270 family protein [Micromonospora sp. NBC_01813]WSA06251.1 CU044_5270 family protein [Micromonospora sp. NBC_01813]
MRINGTRPEEAGRQLDAPLGPPPARDLPAGRHHFHREQLMTMIDQETRTASAATGPAPAAPARTRWRLPRLAIAVPTVATALAGLIVVGVALNPGGDPASQTGPVGGSGNGLAAGPAYVADPDAGSPDGAPELLGEIALVAATGHTGPIRADQFIYVESQVASTYESHNADTGETTLVRQGLHRRQVWLSPDGHRGWLIDSLNEPAGITLDSDVRSVTYDLLTTLPTDPDALLEWIYAETRGQGNHPDHQAFTTIGDLIGEQYLPADLSAALYRAAATIPGVLLVDDATDAIGRSGVAVARVEEGTGVRHEWIFDRNDHTFLGSRTVYTTAVSDSIIPAGTVGHSKAVVTRAVVDEMKQLP